MLTVKTSSLILAPMEPIQEKRHPYLLYGLMLSSCYCLLWLSSDWDGMKNLSKRIDNWSIQKLKIFLFSYQLFQLRRRTTRSMTKFHQSFLLSKWQPILKTFWLKNSKLKINWANLKLKIYPKSHLSTTALLSTTQCTTWLRLQKWLKR